MGRVELEYADASGRRLGVLRSFALSATSGDDANDFELRVPTFFRIPLHGFAYLRGSEVGGVVDGDGVDRTGEAPVRVYTGRTWSGVLAKSVVSDDGVFIGGEANAAIASLLDRQWLSGAFVASGVDSGVTLEPYAVARFTDAYSALRGALSAAGARLSFSRAGGRTVVSAVRASDLRDGPRTSASYRASANARPVNHLVCAGEGEGAARAVAHIYADASGNVSRSQSLFGVDEVAELYECGNADEAELAEKGAEKMREIQAGARTLEASGPSSADPHVGDYVSFYEPDAGYFLRAPVTSVTVEAGGGGAPSVSYDTGSFMPVSMSGQSGGGPGYRSTR